VASTEVIKFGPEDVRASISLPLFRANKVAWIALTSLCHQQEVTFPWELVVAEEVGHDPLGLGGLLRYKNALASVGCQKLVYVPLTEWVPLSQKWRLIGSKLDPNSKFMVIQAADCYSPPKRLVTAWRVFSSGHISWFQGNRHQLYDIKTGKAVLYTQRIGGPLTPGADMVVQADLVRKLPQSSKTKGVDMWLITNCAKAAGNNWRLQWDNTDNWKYGLNVHGVNNISLRRAFFDGGHSPKLSIKPIPRQKLEETIPRDILRRLNRLRPLAESMRRRPWRQWGHA